MNGNDDRRRDDRRRDFVSLAEYTVPELRKAALTLTLLVLVLGLFLYMVSGVIVAVIAGIVAGVYLIPVDQWLNARTGKRALSAVLTIILFTVPLIAVLAYSWIEISGAAEYLSENSADVVSRLNAGLQALPFANEFDLRDNLQRWVALLATSVGDIAGDLTETVDELTIGIAVFLFTTFYILTDHERLRVYLRSRIPGRYRSIVDPVAANIRAVIYGVLYGTFLTQAMKSVIILAMNVIWQVPLAVVLAIASFFVGLLPIVGSWSIYTPVAIYLMLWRDNLVGGILVLLIGFIGNTVIISTYLRPKIAAEKSRVLNFYWMFIALVTGVYTFGLMGIIIGPVLISVLKAILDSVSATEMTTMVPAEAGAQVGVAGEPAD
ncbi:MAG: AI-2E family transporter [Longimicrobiales bacterium]